MKKKNKLKDFMKGYRFISPQEVVDSDEVVDSKNKKKNKEPIKYDGKNLLYFLLQSTVRND